MTTHTLDFLPLLFTVSVLFSSAAAHTEVITDGTWGPSVRPPGPDYAIEADLGRQYGSNLFHSFHSFNLENGESAVFSGPPEVRNVLARVTGGQPSEIDGTLRSTLPRADLYFINPAGIRFGPHAMLDVKGAFHASTADYLRLGEQGRFDAATPENSILSIAPPAAFGFIRENPAPISVEGSTLAAPRGLSLAGGDLLLTESALRAPDGQIHIAAVAGSGEVGVEPEKADLDAFAHLGDIRIFRSEPGGFYGAVDSGGGIFIRGGNLLLDNAAVNARGISQDREDLLPAGFKKNSSKEISPKKVSLDPPFSKEGGQGTERKNRGIGQSGDGIYISIRETVTLQNAASISTDNFSTGNRNAGDIMIRADAFNMHDKTAVSSGNRNAGDIMIRADAFNMRDKAAVSSDTQTAGSGGTVSIQANRFSMTGMSNIGSETLGGGPGGDIRISAKRFRLRENAQINALAYASDHPAGQVSVNADELTMTEDATINTGSFFDGAGDGGNISIKAKTLSMADRAWIVSSSFNRGQSGSIHVGADTLTLTGEAAIAGNAFGRGKGGAINVQARGTALLSGAAVISSGTQGQGKGGDITLHAKKITITNGAGVSSASEGKNIFVREIENLAELAVLSGGENHDGFTGGGDGGQVSIEAENLVVASGAIDSSSNGTGMAGNIDIALHAGLRMRAGRISTAAAYADGGNIKIEAAGVVDLHNSAITASVGGGAGDGGNIAINEGTASEYVILSNSRVIANAFGGRGGNIFIRTEHFFQSADSRVDASSALGIDGIVRIDAPDEDIGRSAIVFPAKLLNMVLSLGLCRMDDKWSHFAITLKGLFTLGNRTCRMK
ncbi:MAG: filamentous hemagglutinin N-terminal domain-containing protein [Gammaproteobacteria bacterium]|nr:filamentous hemagglutinin N-terminal domain-containing protein [Gammaproteobacteria bacterium]